VLAGVSGARSGWHVIRRGIRRAGEDDAELLVVDVNVAEDLDQPRAEALERYRHVAPLRGRQLGRARSHQRG
jgi:K+-sensing histidine kinase KdpD